MSSVAILPSCDILVHRSGRVLVSMVFSGNAGDGYVGMACWVVQVFGWLVGGMPPLSFGHFPRERGQPEWFSDVVPD